MQIISKAKANLTVAKSKVAYLLAATAGSHGISRKRLGNQAEW